VNTAQTSEDSAERNLHGQIVQCLLSAEDQTALLVRVSGSVHDSSMASGRCIDIMAESSAIQQSKTVHGRFLVKLLGFSC